MATYAIGDIQGCYDSFCALLDQIHFSKRDQLWLAGDLVNRGPESLKVLRFIQTIKEQVIVVLGNHDLHLLALATGVAQKKHQALLPILNAPDRDELITWLQQQPLLHDDADSGYVMTHAGIPHIWSLEQAKQLASEVASCLRSADATAFFKQMYGDTPNPWHESLTHFSRLRVITNYFTRMRFIQKDGKLNFNAKGELASKPPNYSPWFNFPSQIHNRIQLTGHWAALGLRKTPQHIALDTGCVWGGKLTAFCLEDQQIVSINAREPN